MMIGVRPIHLRGRLVNAYFGGRARTTVHEEELTIGTIASTSYRELRDEPSHLDLIRGSGRYKCVIHEHTLIR